MIRRPPRSTLFPSRRSSDLDESGQPAHLRLGRELGPEAIERLLQREPRSEQDAVRLPESLDRLRRDRKSTRLNSSHSSISYAVFCLKKKTYQMTSANVH